jgi:hypothetical protein
MELALHPEGTHVLQKIIQIFAENERQNLTDVLCTYTNVFNLCQDLKGISVIKRLISFNKEKNNMVKLVESFYPNLLQISRSSCGSYIIQFLIEQWGIDVGLKLIHFCILNFEAFAIYKHSANLINKIILICLKRNSIISVGHNIVSKPTKIEDFNSYNENPDLNNRYKDNKLLKNIDYPLIHISAKNEENYKPFKSNHILNNFDFTQAIEYEDRKFFRIFYIYLIKKEKLLNIIFLKPPLELLPLRAILFLFNYSCSIFLNSFFYFSDKISFKYRYHGKYKTLLVLINNLTVSLSSTIISLILIVFFKFLTHSSRKIEKLFLDEEIILRSDKKYKVKRKKKLLIKYSIQKILKSLEIKIVVFIIFEFLFILFFFYYVTAFCHVYKKTQVNWLLNSFSSFVISSLIAVSISFLLSIIYKISTKNKCKFLYCISIFFYN